MLNIKLKDSKDYSRGIKISPYNLNVGSYQGTMIGGVNRVSRSSNKKKSTEFKLGNFKGKMFGFSNNVCGGLEGLAVSVINNKSRELRGSEIGLVNYSHESIRSYQVGGINIIDDKYIAFSERKKDEPFWKSLNPLVQFGLVNVVKNYAKNRLVIQFGAYCKIGKIPSIGINIRYEKRNSEYSERS